MNGIKKFIIMYEYTCAILIGIIEAIVIFSNDIMNQNDGDCYHIVDLALIESIINISVPLIVIACFMILCFKTVDYYDDFFNKFGDKLLKLWIISEILRCIYELFIAIMISNLQNFCYNYPQPDMWQIRSGSIVLRYALAVIQICCIFCMIIIHFPVCRQKICKEKIKSSVVLESVNSNFTPNG